MTRRDVGLTLRLLGPLLQVACLVVLLRGVSGTWRDALLGLFLLGLVLVLVGIALSRNGPAAPSDPDAGGIRL